MDIDDEDEDEDEDEDDDMVRSILGSPEQC
jgi:hypothetical protein